MAAFFLAFFTVAGRSFANRDGAWPLFDETKLVMPLAWPTVAVVAICVSELDDGVAPGESDRRSGVKAR